MAMARLPVLLWHLGRRGGGPRYTMEMARALLERDDIVLHLALSRQSDLYDETCVLGAPVLGIDTYDGVPGFLSGFARLPAIGGHLATLLRSQQIKVALCTMTHLWNPFLAPAIKRGGALNALVVHDARAHPGENQWIHRRRIAIDIDQADALIALSTAVRQQLAAFHGADPAAVGLSWHPPFRHVPATARRPRAMPSDPFRLLFFGRLLPYKGLDQLLAAMTLLRVRGVRVRLRIVGQGPVALPDSGADDIVIERGWVPESAIAAIFTESDLLVVPYQEASQSGVISIAHHAGLPTLVTPVGGLVEQVANGDVGYIAGGTDAVAIAAAIESILAAPERYRQIAATLMAKDSDADWRRAADGIVAFLRTRVNDRADGAVKK